MDYKGIIKDIEYIQGIRAIRLAEMHGDEVYINVKPKDFAKMCFGLHQWFGSPVMMLFASDERQGLGSFVMRCVFLSYEFKKWFIIEMNVAPDYAKFESLAKDIYSAALFEREIKEMFGVQPENSPDLRRLNLHDEVWPDSFFPLRKDFKPPLAEETVLGEYRFKKVDGEGIFEVPVGPVHAGIIGPGHFRFSVAGEPIVSLEIRLGFTHRGVEKLFEGKDILSAVRLSECVSGDAAFSHSLSFCNAIEKICAIEAPERALILRAVFLELERMYNHIADISGMALDVGFSFPSMYAAVIKEQILNLNEKLSGSRYLKNINTPGGVNRDISIDNMKLLSDFLLSILKDAAELKNMLYSNVSFMDRVDKTGVLKKEIALDLGVLGPVGRASGVSTDLRKIFAGVYNEVKFKSARQKDGDALARLNIRFAEFEESGRLVKEFLKSMKNGPVHVPVKLPESGSFALGYCEGWRGPVLYWVKIDSRGMIDRCKIVDPSFRNWQGLPYAVLGNIIPDFPLCNKSFNLSYSGNDL